MQALTCCKGVLQRCTAAAWAWVGIRLDTSLCGAMWLLHLRKGGVGSWYWGAAPLTQAKWPFPCSKRHNCNSTVWLRKLTCQLIKGISVDISHPALQTQSMWYAKPKLAPFLGLGLIHKEDQNESLALSPTSAVVMLLLQDYSAHTLSPPFLENHATSFISQMGNKSPASGSQQDLLNPFLPS